MKKTRMISLILACMMMLAMFAGCESKLNPDPEIQELIKGIDDLRIGIAAPDVTHGWVAGVAYYAEKFCKNNGLKYKVTTSSDASEMAANLDDLVTWGASVIVVWPQWTGMETKISEIIASGIPVVSFDMDIPSEGIYKVTGDNYGMGYKSAEYILSKVGSAASIAVLDVPSAGSVSALRKQGFYDYLKEKGYDTSNIFEVSLAAFTRESGLSAMTDILASREKVDAIFSLDDETSIGAIQALTELGRTDVKAITGGGGMQEYFRMIADSKYKDLGLSSALYSPSMVEKAVESAIRILKGEKSEQEIVIPTTIVTSENVSSFIDPENTVY